MQPLMIIIIDLNFSVLLIVMGAHGGFMVTLLLLQIFLLQQSAFMCGTDNCQRS